MKNWKKVFAREWIWLICSFFSVWMLYTIIAMTGAYDSWTPDGWLWLIPGTCTVIELEFSFDYVICCRVVKILVNEP
jgi:hypothetical protein